MAESINIPKKLDYTLQSPEERIAFVEQLIESNENPEEFTEKYKEILANYIIFAMDKQERKERKILTDNRMVTVNKRETSYQGLVSKFENGEDGVFNLITEDKNVLLTPKVSITPKDIEEIPPLQELKKAIAIIEQQEKKATGKKKYLLKKQLIEMYQDQYVIKDTFRQPIHASGYVKMFIKADLADHITIDAAGEPINTGLVSFFNPTHISALLCNYALLKEESYGDLMRRSVCI